VRNTNHVQSLFKRKQAIRGGAKLKPRDHPPRPPQQRLLASGTSHEDLQRMLEGASGNGAPLETSGFRGRWDPPEELT
jgi:hypothetical protein